VINVIATYFGFRYIDKVGRRPLAIGGFAGMAVFIWLRRLEFLSSAGHTEDSNHHDRFFSFFITSFAIGVGGTGWLIQGEVFPTSVRGRAAAVGAGVDWLANFVIILVFPLMTTALGLGWVMVLFRDHLRGSGPVRAEVPARDQGPFARGRSRRSSNGQPKHHRELAVRPVDRRVMSRV